MYKIRIDKEEVVEYRVTENKYYLENEKECNLGYDHSNHACESVRKETGEVDTRTDSDKVFEQSVEELDLKALVTFINK